MSFWDTAGQYGAQTLGAGLGGGAASAIMGGITGNSAGAQKRSARKQFNRTMKHTKKSIKWGNKADLANQKAMFDYRIDQGLDYGMTPYEMFMGPAAGAGGGTSGSGQTLGNAASSAGNTRANLEYQDQVTQRENNADRAVQLAQTKMQTDAQRDVAKTQAGATEYGADLNYQAAMQRLTFDQEVYSTTNLPQAAATLRLTEKQTEKVINEIATSEPDFVRFIKLMTMGVDNMTAMVAGSEFGDLSNPKTLLNMSPEKRKKAIAAMLSAKSQINTEIAGATEGFGRTVESILQGMYDILRKGMGHIENLFGIGGIEALGNSQSSNSGAITDPGNYGPSSP